MASQTDQQLLEGEMQTEAVRAEIDDESDGSGLDYVNTLAQAQQEEEMANQLALQQSLNYVQTEVQGIAQEGLEYSHPSYFKYSFLFGLAGIADALDLLQLTGVGAIVSFFTSIFCNALIVLIFWLTNTKQNDAKKYVKNINSRLEDLGSIIASYEKNLAHVERRAAQIGKYSVKLARKFEKSASFLGKILKWGSLVAETIPFADFGFLPLTIVSVWLSYRDEKQSYENAARTGSETYNQLSENTA